MISRIFVVGIFIVSLMSRSAKAEYEIGFSGQSGWSDNFFLANPDGWGISLSKRPSRSFAIRFSLSRFDDSFTYKGKMQFGFVPVDANAPRELIDSDASSNLYELTLHYALLNSRRWRLEAGGGFGVSHFDLNLVGRTTDKVVSTAQSPFILTLSVDATVKKLIYSPLSLSFSYQYREFGGIPIELDGFQPFVDFYLSGVRVALLVNW